MKKKIDFQLMAISSVAIFATMILISSVFYELYQSQIIDDLRSYSNLLVESSMVEHMQGSGYTVPADRVRITIMNADGTVWYDNEASSQSLDNHKSRPEVQEALENGEGIAVRHSSTMQKSTFYYARILENGDILRLAREAGSIWSISYSTLPFVVIMVFFLLVICLLVSHFLTKRLISPIEQLAQNLDNMSEITAYEELQPFITMIQEQHKDIMRNAMIRQEFSANVSHELKTPLTSISGYAQLIETGMASDEDVIRFAKGIHANANRLFSLISDTIRLSELDSGEQEVLFGRESLKQLARNCLDMLQFSAEKHKINMNLSGEECSVWGNKQMVEEVLYNLCDNAIRYNNEGGRVDVNIKDLGEHAQLTITDTGIGIPRDAQERIFERFYRVDKSRSKSTGGTGLGLAIVKHITATLGAKISLQSEVGKGTKVTVLFKKNESDK